MYDERRRHLEETEDFVAAEKAHNIIDDVLEELLNVHSERLELLDGAGQDDGFIDKVKASGARVCELTREVHERTHRLPAAPVPDMQRVDAAIEEAKTKLRDDNERHKKRESDLLAQLKDNEDEQAHKFERMMEVHDQIVELAAERQALVEQLMSQTQDINARHAAHDVFVEQCAAHRRLLDSLASMTQVIAPTLVSTEPFVQHTLQAIDTTVSDARRDTADVMLRERRAYYKVFHEFYLVCGEMLYTKERRREEIDGQLEDAKWNVKMCRHTLDPNVRVYQERVKQLELTRTAVDADIADLMRRMDSAASEASPVEDMLQEAGDDIVSPAILLQEQNVAKQQALIVEKKIVTERKTAKVEQLEEEAARVAVSASAAKRSGGTTSQMRPLSPSGPGEAPANAALSLSPEKRRALGDQKRRNYAERLRRTVGTENGGVDPSLQFGSPDKGGSTVIRQGRGNMVV